MLFTTIFFIPLLPINLLFGGQEDSDKEVGGELKQDSRPMKDAHCMMEFYL